MREYKETAITGHQYTRCKSVQIVNDLGAPNRPILFGEETVAVIGDTNITASKGSVINVLTPDNCATEFDIIDFETMQPTGCKMTYAEVYAVMASSTCTLL